MAAKYDLITELYLQTVTELSAPDRWQAFLTTACRNFRLPFQEQILLFAQRPDATAVLPIEGKNGWNRRFGRWVNRGSKGIAMFDSSYTGKSRLKYYFDIADTHESSRPRPVPIWEVQPKYEVEIVESLENSFGQLKEKTDLGAALVSAASNAMEDHFSDYLAELSYYKEGSFLEPLDEESLEALFKPLLQNSIGYMLLVRCGMDPADHFTNADFDYIKGFNTLPALNALGTATSDISQMCLSEIARTVLSLQRQEQQRNRKFAESQETKYSVSEKQTERSNDHAEPDIHETGRLSASQPPAAPGARDSPWEVRNSAPQISPAAPPGDLHESSDHRQAERPSSGDPADSPDPAEPDGEGPGRDGGTESQRPHEVGGVDEQYQGIGGGADPDGAGVQLEPELPPLLEERFITAIIENRDDDLKSPKQEIQEFFQNHPEQAKRADYLKSVYPDRYTELIVDGTRIGYKTTDDGLLMWEGAYLSRTRESVFSWGIVAELTGNLMEQGTYFLNTQIKAPPSIEEQQMSFLAPDYSLPEVKEISFLSAPRLPQQIIDEALCIGSNEEHSRLIICAYFMKDKPLQENARFLMEHYGENGAGFYFGDRQYSVWYNAEGFRVSSGESVRRFATVLSWEDAAKRIRELLDLGRYMPQSEIDRAPEFEKARLADDLLYMYRDIDGDGKESYFLSMKPAYDLHGGFPDMSAAVKKLLEQPDTLQTLVDDCRAFIDAYEKDHSILRFRYRPKELLQRLTDLQREPLIFTAAEGLAPQRRFFISGDELDQVLRGSTDYRLAVYSFYRNNPDRKEREKFLKNYHGEYSGYHGGNDNRTYTSKGLLFSHGSITEPYAKVELSWSKVEKRVSELIASDRFISGEDRAAMPAYELHQLARDIHTFFESAPVSFPQPYPRDMDYSDAVALIARELQDPSDVEEIHQMMLPVWKATAQDDRDYPWRKKGFENLSAFRDGTFSLFGEVKAEISKLPQELTGEQHERTAEDDFSDIDPAEIRERLAQRGIVNGEVVDPDALNNDPFIRQVMADAEAVQAEPEEQPDQEDNAIAPPKAQPKRERITFAPILPEIPREQRHNFRIDDPELGYGTPGQKYAANVAAIRLLKRIEEENRLATPMEQQTLSGYVGWGGLADCFDEKHPKYQELKALLSEEEYAAARSSSLTAFYTSPVIIGAMYQALEQMGFREGNILEPSCGVGNFIGMIPDAMARSHAYGVELDSISGRIAQQLYQNSSIAVTGFEKVQMPDSFFDVAIGNVPFGDFKVLDKRYDKHHWLIHDYFFGKALDKVRPGGVVAFITSKGTMDKENSAVRKYLAQRADLIGAIRLPNTAFKANAGTEVTSDIIFLQKRDRMTDIESDWVHLDTDANGIRMNRYFVQNPDMILGDMVMESTRFGMDSVCRPFENADLSELLRRVVSNLHAEIAEYSQEELEEEDNAIPADPNVRNFSYTIVDGKVYFRENSRMVPVEVSLTAENRIRGMIALRDCVRRLIEYQTEGYPDEDIQKEQVTLNTLYDEYTKKYGLISSRGNSLAFSEDSSYFLLCSLEVLDEEGNFKRKADMFSKRTIRPHVAITSVDTASEALAVSIAEKARVDMEYMSALSGKTAEELETELAGVIFRDIQCAEDAAAIPKAFVDLDRFPFVTAEEYLSGNVRRKLRMVKALREVLPEEKVSLIQQNITALEAVQPVDLTAGEIGVRIGVNWVPKEVYEQFLYEVFGTSVYARDKIKVLYSPHTGEWNVTNKSMDGSNIKAVTTYGTKRINAYHIFEQTLNQKDVRIYDTRLDADGNEVRVLNKKETAIAQDRQELIKTKFSEWIWKDIDRRERLCGIYNETFNALRPREYDGQHIRFSGMNPEITLRKHQINAIAHILYGGNTLLAHEVGAGKTFEIVAAAMEMKRLGLCTKSLIVVPNHITEQWAAEWLQLYPSANILVATKKDFETRNRKKFCARIATGDYDAIIIGHSQFEKIPMSAERQKLIIKRQIDSILDGIRDAKRSHVENYSIKQMERTRKSLENRLAKLNDQSRKDDIVTFEQLGVDRVFVDESHYFKNMFLATKMRNVGGIAQAEAQKSSDLFMKCQYLDEITGNRGVIFATGTPISNSMVELFTIQRYLQYSTLEEMGLLNFDDWAANYGETVTAIELSPEGSGYRSKTRFAKFYNLPELMSTFKMVADIQTADMLKLPVPKANFHTVVLKPSPMQQDMIRSLADRAEEIRAGNVDPSVDNMLKITNDGRKLALDMRLIQPLAPDDENGKVSVCAKNVYDIWERTQEQRSAQLVFCDLSTPGKTIDMEMQDGVAVMRDFQNVYDDLKKKLIARGVPAEEIAFIHEANTEVRKKELFARVRSGQVRVLIGSTAKMGAGTNVQDRLVALHDLDCRATRS